MAAKLTGPALTLSKVSILAIWAWGIACFFLDPTMGSWVTAGRYVAGGLLAAHALELLIYVPKLMKANQSVGSHIAPLLIYGGIHFFSLEIADGASSEG